jgi:probable O-glycosylation ligase (exosortase A-associated)
MLWAVVTLHAFNAIRPFVDYTTFFILTATLVDRTTRIKVLAWTLFLVCLIVFARNIDKLGGTTRIGGFKAGYFLGDGNDLAWGMVIALPLISYLLLVERGLLSRLAAVAGIVICLFVVVGTGSRGGTLALGVSLLFYVLFVSRRRLMGILAVGLVTAGILLFAPGGYSDRMKTIGAYEQDSSAQTRLMMWRAAAKMAIDFPLGVGAGNFASAYGRHYSPQRNSETRVGDVVWAPTRWLNAHSIFFKTLGEYGYLGLLMLLALIAINIRDSLVARSSLLTAHSTKSISPYWPALVAMSVCGFAVGGIFLGGLAYPHMFFLSGLVVANTRLVRGVARSIDVPQATEPRIEPKARGPGPMQR